MKTTKADIRQAVDSFTRSIESRFPGVSVAEVAGSYAGFAAWLRVGLPSSMVDVRDEIQEVELHSDEIDVREAVRADFDLRVADREEGHHPEEPEREAQANPCDGGDQRREFPMADNI